MPGEVSKRFATLRARAMLSDIALHQIEDDAGRPLYIATRWELTKQFADLDKVEAWLEHSVDRPKAVAL